MLINDAAYDSSNDTKEQAFHYMKTLVDVARESFLILDADLRVISGNPTFYENFKVSPAQTEGVLVYELGNGQWNIVKLRDLLEKILPEKKAVRDYEVTHIFETIGQKTIMLNAKQIDSVKLIIVAMEDITEKKGLEEKLVEYTKMLEDKVSERTLDLADKVKQLESLNVAMIGRENKMADLKEEIKDLKA